MKKFILLASMLGLLGSCSNELTELESNVKVQSEQKDAHSYVSYEQALDISRHYISNTTDTRAASYPSVKNHFIWRETKNKTRGVGDSIEVAFHVINFGDNAGFAIVSTDARTTPVYAYSHEGNISEESFETNAGLQFFMESATDLYREEVLSYNADLVPTSHLDIPIPLPEDSIPLNCIIVTVDGERFYRGGYSHDTRVSCSLGTEWGSYYPYNAQFPDLSSEQMDINSMLNNKKAPTSGAVSIGQIAAYFCHPSTHGGVTFDWNAINAQNGFVYGSNPGYNSNCVSSLLSEISSYLNSYITVNDNYDNLGDIRSTIRHFGFNASSRENFSSSNVCGSIGRGHPVIAYGEPYLNGYQSTGSCTWVIDSYEYHYNVVIHYYTDPPYNEAFRRETTGPTYFHCNWGENGNDNGYYLNTFNRIHYGLRNVKTICDIYPED